MGPWKSGQLNFYLRSQQTGTIKVKWCDYFQVNYLRTRVVRHSHVAHKLSRPHGMMTGKQMIISPHSQRRALSETPCNKPNRITRNLITRAQN